MGLDQYAYVAARANQYDDFYSDAEFVNNEFVSPAGVSKPRELAYWRKHPNLHGWMERLWTSKGRPCVSGAGDMFNGIELELTWDDIARLERDIKDGTMAQFGTTGFFFGDAKDYYYREHDLKFCVDARAELFLGLRVFYNSSW